MYSYDKSKKRITFNDEPLTTREVVEHLSQMYQALEILASSWRIISDGVAYMDSVFLGATRRQEIADDAVLSDSDDSEMLAVPEGDTDTGVGTE